MQKYYSQDGTNQPDAELLHQKQNANVNPIGRSNQNTILDTNLYEVAFTEGEMTELTANMIAESMYAHCDVDG